MMEARKAGKNRATSEVSTIYGKTLRVTCVERRYKVIDSKNSFTIVAKKELDEDTTEKLLHEDMELKTFLANYEIDNIIFPSQDRENIEIEKHKIPAGRYGIGKSDIGRRVKGKSEILTPDIEKEESESTKKRREIIMNNLKRRELFDSLNLPEEFLVSDYSEAIEKNGLKLSSSRMSRDDLKYWSKMGRVELIRKNDRGNSVYKLIKKTENEEKDEQENMLPSNEVIDSHIT